MRQLLAIFRQLDLNGDEDLEKGEIIEGLRDNEQLRDYLQQVPKLRFLLQTDAWTKMLFGMETSDSDSVKFGEFYCFAVMIMGFSNTEHILGGEEDEDDGVDKVDAKRSETDNDLVRSTLVQPERASRSRAQASCLRVKARMHEKISAAL